MTKAHTDRAVAEAVAAYRAMVRLECKAVLAERDLRRVLAEVPEEGMQEYVRLTTEVDDARERWEDWLVHSNAASSTQRQYLSNHLSHAGTAR